MLSNIGFERVTPKELSYAKLLAYDSDKALQIEIDEKRLNKVRVELQKRFALPLACMILGLFSVPVACVFRALKQQYGLLLAMCVFLLYYSMLSIAESLGESMLLRPAIGLWIPNVAFLVTGLYFLRQAVREQMPASVSWVLQKLQGRGA